MSEAAHQQFGERFAETVYRLLHSVGEAEAARRIPAVKQALKAAATALATVAGEDIERATEAAAYGFEVRGGELGYLGSDRPKTLAEACRRCRVGEIAALLDKATPNTAEAYLRSLGADPKCVARHGRLWVLPGAHPILRATDEDKKPIFFEVEPDERTVDFAIMQATAEGGELLLDYAAWNVARPAEFWALVGGATLLGEPTGSPLMVHRTPAMWLAANCDGVVVLNDRAGPALACAPGDIAAEDLAHARELACLIHPFTDPGKIVRPA